MTRKSKQPGGINPLTYGERAKLKEYGTETCRLTTDSQHKFGRCQISLDVAVDPVATPSGHVYSREAIVDYLLTKNRELKKQRLDYETQLEEEKQKKSQEASIEEQGRCHSFVRKSEGTIQKDRHQHASDFDSKMGKKIDIESIDTKKKSLKRTSYWLSQNAPDHVKETLDSPPARPPSPMSGQPLRLKDLISLDFKIDEKGEQILCAVSGNALTTQEVVVIKKTRQVMLKEMFEKMAKPSMTCPITGKKFKDKDMLELKKAATGYAASGEVQAKKYRHTLT